MSSETGWLVEEASGEETAQYCLYGLKKALRVISAGHVRGAYLHEKWKRTIARCQQHCFIATGT